MESITDATCGWIMLAAIATVSAFMGSYSYSHSHAHSHLGKDVHENDFFVDISWYSHVKVNARLVNMDQLEIFVGPQITQLTGPVAKSQLQF